MSFKFLRKLLITLFIILTYVPVQLTFAENSSTPSANVDSYNLFWPLAAGKTEEDRFYFLKLFKEQAGGWVIFDDLRKADYAIFLGSKRVLEAEKLLQNGKQELALKALDKANIQFSSAYNFVKNASSKRKISRNEIRRDRLIHVKTLIDYLKNSSPEKVQPVLEKVKDKADSTLRDYLP